MQKQQQRVQEQHKQQNSHNNNNINNNNNQNQGIQLLAHNNQLSQKRSFKSKCGIFFGYNGQKFLGMQYQRDTQNTIQNILHRILIDGGFILKSNQSSLKRIHWSRAARTDKKVHALCNGISLRIQINQQYTKKQENNNRQPDFDKIREYINSELPYDIRVFSIIKANKSFDIRHDALTRVYNYICPMNMFQKYEQFRAGHIPTEQQQQQIINKLNNLCKLYIGTHSYHNLTKGYRPNDPRCDRYMLKMFVQKVQQQVFDRYWSLQEHKIKQVNRDRSKQKFIRFTLVGQSFIYHQIRKMIGLLIKIFTQELQGEETIKKAFRIQKFDPFLAPGQGLYLNRMTFESYNRKKRENNQKTVELNQQQQQRICKFRQYLQSQILHHQIQQKVFELWLINRFQFIVQELNEQNGQNGQKIINKNQEQMESENIQEDEEEMDGEDEQDDQKNQKNQKNQGNNNKNRKRGDYNNNDGWHNKYGDKKYKSNTNYKNRKWNKNKNK